MTIRIDGLACINNGGAGVRIDGGGDIEINNLYSRGNKGGDVDVGKVGNLTITNSDLEGSAGQEPANEPTKSKPRKFFSGFSFSKGDHLKG